MFLLNTLLIASDNASSTAQAPNILTSLLPMFLIFGVFYIILIRPQQKKQKAFHEQISSLKTGSEIVTSGGIIGKISKIEEHANVGKIFHIESLSSSFQISANAISKIL